MKKFPTNRTGAPLFVSIGSAIILISALSSPNVSVADPTFLGIAFVYLLIIADIILGNYVTIADDRLSTIDGFFFKQSVNLDSISHISYSPQFIGGMGAKMLTVRFKNGNEIRTLNVGSNHFFSRKTMAAIIKEIRDRNPNVEMDQAAENLMRTYAK